jgi:hypothetical protein
MVIEGDETGVIHLAGVVHYRGRNYWDRIKIASPGVGPPYIACAGSDDLGRMLRSHSAYLPLINMAKMNDEVGSWGALCPRSRFCLQIGVHWNYPVLVLVAFVHHHSSIVVLQVKAGLLQIAFHGVERAWEAAQWAATFLAIPPPLRRRRLLARDYRGALAEDAEDSDSDYEAEGVSPSLVASDEE